MKIPEHVPWQSTGTTLGSGGQGVVQLVTKSDQTNGRMYALKHLRNAGSNQARDRFRREIEVVKQIDAPSIVRVFDHSKVDDDFHYYVMEYHKDARTLASIIFSADNPYHGDIRRSLDLFESIVSAIGACEASSPQIVHRDIKPNNILVLPDGTIRLIDFGVCQVNDGEMITLVDENVGTRNYASPECEAGNDGAIGVHSDLYSAAKVLWAAITSKQAFAREAPAFRGRSMERMFPRMPETWHLSRIFEETIRQETGHRCQNSEAALALASEVRYLVRRGFPPLRLVKEICPSCGSQSIGDFNDGYIVFGNPNPRGVVSLICYQCGFGFVRNTEIWRDAVDRLESLD